MLGFSDQLGVWGCPQFWPRGAQKGPKLPKNGQNLTLRALEVRNGWNGVERSWNELRDTYVEIFRPIGSLGVPPILAQGRPKRAQIDQKRPKSDLEASGGPERLEQRGTKLEQVTAPHFGPGAPKKGPNGLKLAKI